MIDTTTDVIHAALSGLAARQRVTADNLSNLETPGYVAGRVSFEDALRNAVGSGDPSAVKSSLTSSTDAANPNGNNVQIDNEIVSATETQVRYQLMVEAMSNKFKILQTAIGRH